MENQTGPDEQRLSGGVNVVTRIGATVRRPTGPWTPAVHELLRHLESAGFDGAPRVHGLDEQGREVLDFIDGEIADGSRAGYPAPFDPASSAHIEDVARLIRRYHDATEDYAARVPADHVWYLPGQFPAEVICHGDLAPYNAVFGPGGTVLAFFDFDTAHPGPRVWDLAYAAYRFLPLGTPADPVFCAPLPEQARRLAVFADAYGLGERDREVLVTTSAERLRQLAAHMTARARAGDAAFAAHIEAGHLALYVTDARFLDDHAAELSGPMLGR